jgi:hypothetical protein
MFDCVRPIRFESFITHEGNILMFLKWPNESTSDRHAGDSSLIFSHCKTPLPPINTHLFLIHFWIAHFFCPLISMTFGPLLTTLSHLMDRHIFIKVCRLAHFLLGNSISTLESKIGKIFYCVIIAKYQINKSRL